MPTAIVFDLISALVDKFDAVLPQNVAIYDGPGASDAAGDFVMVGVGDPTSDALASAATGSLEWAGLGNRSSKENGSIVCSAVASSGAAGSDAQRAVRETVRDYAATIEAALRDDPNLAGAVPGLHWVRYAGDFSLDQPPTDGSLAVFRFEIQYIASL